MLVSCSQGSPLRWPVVGPYGMFLKAPQEGLLCTQDREPHSEVPRPSGASPGEEGNRAKGLFTSYSFFLFIHICTQFPLDQNSLPM